MNGLIKAAIAATAVCGVAGCGMLPTMPSVPAKDRAQFAGRAFYVGSVTVAPQADAKSPIDTHCLPDADYAKMLKEQMVSAFDSAGLTKGLTPAVPVNVTITFMRFEKDLGAPTSKLTVSPSLGDVVIDPVSLHATGSIYYSNVVSDWQKERRILPTMAIDITNGINEIKHGKDFNDQPTVLNGSAVMDYWTHVLWNGYHNRTPKDGLHQPLTIEDVERMTGTSAAKLAAVCEADESRA